MLEVRSSKAPPRSHHYQLPSLGWSIHSNQLTSSSKSSVPSNTFASVMSGSSLAVEASPPSTPSGLIDPVPLSMPSILVNAKPTNLASHTLASRAINKPPPSSSSSSSSHRHIGRRKLLRRVNSIPSSHNPHAVTRPRASDYLPSHAGQERYRGTFPSPTPRYLREVGKQGEIRDARQARDLRVEWEKGVEDEALRRRREEAAAAGRELKPGDRGLEQGAAAPPDSGLFTMSIQEARFFLTRRAGVVVSRGQQRRDEAEAPPPELTPMQHLVDCLEAELQAWSNQLVYRPGAHDIGGSSTGFNPHPTVLVEADSFESPTSSHVARVEEHHRLPQSLVLCIPDAFDRLTVHCLARVWGMRSFSKPAPGKGEEIKLTWILKPPPSKAQRQMQRRQQRAPFEQMTAASSAVDAAANAGPAASAGVFSRSQGGLETPPTTDVGTSASELGDSSDDDDGWSLAGDDTVQPYDTSADVSGGPQGDVTLGVVDEEDEGEQTTAAATAGLADRLAGASLLDEHDGYVRSDESAPASDDDYAADDDDLAESGTLPSPLSARGAQDLHR